MQRERYGLVKTMVPFGAPIIVQSGPYYQSSPERDHRSANLPCVSVSGVRGYRVHSRSLRF